MRIYIYIYCIYIYTGWWFQPPWKILVNWDYYSQYMEKQTNKPPTSIYRLVPPLGTTYDGVGGWGGMLTFMWTCRSSWCYAHAGWGGGGWGGMLTFMWTCRSSWCYAHAGWGGGGWGGMLTFMWTCRSSWCYTHAGWGGGGWGDVNVHVNLQMMMI